MINTFIYHAVKSPRTKNAFVAGLGDLIVRINLIHVFKYGEDIMHEDELYSVLKVYFDVQEDAFIVTIYKKS